jgi:hypothetical protein
MKKRNLLLVIALSIPLLGFFGKSNDKKGKPPIILGSYAPRVIQPGGAWRVYLHVKDHDGDIKDITAMLLEPGNVISPISFTRIRAEKDRGEFEGYLYLTTPRRVSFYGRKFLIQIQVRDRELSRSEAVKLPLTFGETTGENIPERWQNAVDNRLGRIMIDFDELDDWRSVY